MVHYRVHHDPKSSHQQISKLIRELRRDPVLDVGCAQGMLAHLVRDLVRDGGLTLDGVEYNPAWAEMARPHYRRVWTGAVEDAPLPDAEYRLVVCGDVLEHTPDPVAVLRRLRRAATDDAAFIISVPNIAHLAVRLMLLFGRFPKMERGPLDRTHLQFLTKDTAREMVESAGLVLKRMTCTGAPLDELWKGGAAGEAGEERRGLVYRAATKLQHAALALAPRLFGYQWIMVAVPAPQRQPNPSAAGAPQAAVPSGAQTAVPG